MNVDPLILPTVLLAAALFWLGMRAGAGNITPAVWVVASALNFRRGTMSLMAFRRPAC